jgi:hypothetical protein
LTVLDNYVIFNIMKKLLIPILFLVSTLNAQYVDVSSQLNSYQTPTISIDGVNRNVYAGEFKCTLEGNNFSAFCTDLGLGLYAGQSYQYSVITDPRNVNTTLNSPAWANSPEISLGYASWIYNQYQNDPNKNSATAAGAQMAIWEVLYDNGVNLNDGRFKVINASSEAIQAILRYTDRMDSSQCGYTYFQRSGNIDGQPQNLITSTIPEPRVYGLIGVLGCMVLTVFNKKKFNNHSK